MQFLFNLLQWKPENLTWTVGSERNLGKYVNESGLSLTFIDEPPESQGGYVTCMWLHGF